jgi:hypothetical protein
LRFDARKGRVEERWHHARALTIHPALNITPTPITAAAAGIVAAMAWPFLWSRYGGSGSEGSIELVISTLLVIALPAHAFVVGFSRGQVGPGTIDTALLKRVGSWLAAAVAATVLRVALQG